MSDDNGFKSALIPMAIAGTLGTGLGAGGTSYLNDQETVVNAATLEACHEFIVHGKNHQRHDDNVRVLELKLKMLEQQLDCVNNDK